MSKLSKTSGTGFIDHTRAAAVHALVMMVRRRRAVLAAVMALVPVLMPLALAFLSGDQFGEDGAEVFNGMVRYFYIEAITPLLALFFACMLIGEDVESQTMPYVLTRSMPRSAFVLGKYLAFLLVATSIIVPSIVLNFVACTSLGGISFSLPDVTLLAEYAGVDVLALIGYGALCMLLGALFKRPIVVGIIIIFGWQKMMRFAPGILDFFTIDKYVRMLVAEISGARITAPAETLLEQFQKKEMLITASKAGVALVVIACILLAVTTYVVRRREYTTARALGG